MQIKDRLRKKYFFLRKKRYFDIRPDFFYPVLNLINRNFKKKRVYLSSYYPSLYEVDTLKLFQTDIKKRLKILLPVIKQNNSMYFYEWELNNVLQINKFGLLEPPLSKNHIVPDVMLIPLLAYDNQNHRLGYGGGFYDRYLSKFLRAHKKIITIGIAFSFQKYHKIPVTTNDVKLNFILTEKGMF